MVDFFKDEEDNNLIKFEKINKKKKSKKPDKEIEQVASVKKESPPLAIDDKNDQTIEKVDMHPLDEEIKIKECSNCGTTIENLDLKFCLECGTKL